MDNKGTYQFPAMRKLAINSGDAFILVYAVNDASSFHELETLRESILMEREQAYLDQQASGINNKQKQQQTNVSNNSKATSDSRAQQGSQKLISTQTKQATVNQPKGDISPARNWSLASLFNHHQQQPTTNNSQTGHSHGHSSLGSSLSSSNHSVHTSISSINNDSNNNNNNTNNNTNNNAMSSSSSISSSRRSSISAAEAALKTRRTRHPPMVIVANKQDLDEQFHLVKSDEAEALVVIDWNNGFVRASAAFNWNIKRIFRELLNQAKQPPTLGDAIVGKRRKSLPPKLPNNNNTHNINISNHQTSTNYNKHT